MRLLRLKDGGEFSLVEFFGKNIPHYAILSHTWGTDDEEVTFKDLVDGTGNSKAGYTKIRFCGEQAANDGLQHFWMDTCCIDKSSSAELSEAINSMFRWYRDAAKCYVYLSDVSADGSVRSDLSSQGTWKLDFQQSRWFTRGWTLQELLAPESVEFFSVEGERLGDKISLVQEIHYITGISIQALEGSPLSQFSIGERLSWSERRETKREEDAAYSLLGICDIHLPLLYGEGRQRAFNRLHKEIDARELTSVVEWDQSTYPAIIPEVRFLTWREFTARVEIDPKRVTQWKHRPEIDPEPKSVIEILLEEPHYEFALTSSSNQKPAHPSQGQLSKILDSFDQALVDPPHQIRIRSNLLLKVINEVTGCKTVLGPHGHRLLLLRPFKLLVTYQPELQAHLNKLEELHKGAEEGHQSETHTVEARNRLRLLCRLIDYFQPQIKFLRNLSPDCRKVKFSELWYIFKPGYEVRTPGNSQIQLYRVLKVSGGRDILSDTSPPELPASKKLGDARYSEGSFIIECFYIDFNGTLFGPVNVTFHIRKFEGEKDIASLPIYPIACDPNKEQIRYRLLKRGNAFTELSNPKSTTHRQYSGLTLDTGRQEYVESEVVVDFQLAFTEADMKKPVISLESLVEDDTRELTYPIRDASTMICNRRGCCGNDIIYNDYEIDEKERSDFSQVHNELIGVSNDPELLYDDQKVLLPPRVYGFVLRTRKWATFDIDHLQYLDYGDGWENLVINQNIKDMILALVENHQRPLGSQAIIGGTLSSVDLVQGKGKGLIILLHGDPGVGKTSTAECVAMHTKRPLYSITCGDIGERADQVEYHLEKNFHLAHKWGCVLLLDEADVFLSKRTSHDIQQNAIASVFLRILEYYSGILFLTTNRVRKIDKAFKSRIHLSLVYPKLDLLSTIRIWENNLKIVKTDFEKQGMKIVCLDDDILAFAKDHFNMLKSRKKKLSVWNGRQIRNAFQTAVAIAKFEARKQQDQKNTPQDIILSANQFKRVAMVAEAFDTYLNAVHNDEDDADLAKLDQLGADDFADELTNVKGKDRDRERPARKRSVSTGRKRRRKRRRNDRTESDDHSSTDSSDSSESDYRSLRRRDGRGHVWTR